MLKFWTGFFYLQILCETVATSNIIRRHSLITHTCFQCFFTIPRVCAIYLRRQWNPESEAPLGLNEAHDENKMWNYKLLVNNHKYFSLVYYARKIHKRLNKSIRNRLFLIFDFVSVVPSTLRTKTHFVHS